MYMERRFQQFRSRVQRQRQLWNGRTAMVQRHGTTEQRNGNGRKATEHWKLDIMLQCFIESTDSKPTPIGPS